MTDVRDHYISKVVEGRSFADVGGLWGTINEKASIAHGFGATDLGMFDLVTPSSDLWAKFAERQATLGLPDVRCVSGDIINLTAEPGHDRYDVVHCSGVLYHVPDQLRLLNALRKLATQYVVLTSVVVPSKIENEEGVLDLPDAGVVFVPALGGRERAIVRRHWEKVVGSTHAIGITCDPEWDVKDYSPWWWMPTIPALQGMCAAAGFDVVESSPSWNGNALTLLLKVPPTV